MPPDPFVIRSALVADAHPGDMTFGRLQGDKYLRFLALVLFAYACFGRAFAYLGKAPVTAVF